MIVNGMTQNLMNQNHPRRMNNMEIKRGMAFDHGKVVEAVEAIKEQGPGSIERIIKDEVKPLSKMLKH